LLDDHRDEGLHVGFDRIFHRRLSGLIVEEEHESAASARIRESGAGIRYGIAGRFGRGGASAHPEPAVEESCGSLS